MYSWEIDRLLRDEDYHIDSETYIYICSSSPQISEIKYHPSSHYFEIWSKDNYFWKFTVYKRKVKL